MDLLIEVFIFLALSLFFSIFYEMDRDDHLWGALIGGLCWGFTGTVYLVWNRPVPAFSLFFVVLGTVYIVRFMDDLIRIVHIGGNRKLEGDSD